MLLVVHPLFLEASAYKGESLYDVQAWFEGLSFSLLFSQSIPTYRELIEGTKILELNESLIEAQHKMGMHKKWYLRL